MRLDRWAIDSYGLRAASNQHLLDQLRDRDRLHVSPLTWNPGESAGAIGRFKASLGCGPISEPSGQLTLVSTGVSHTRNTVVTLDARLRVLHDQGILILDDDHECDPQHVAAVESSWQEAGLAWRPTNETLSAVLTADRHGIDLITEDTDARKLATHWQVQPITIAQFATALAA